MENSINRKSFTIEVMPVPRGKTINLKHMLATHLECGHGEILFTKTQDYSWTVRCGNCLESVSVPCGLNGTFAICDTLHDHKTRSVGHMVKRKIYDEGLVKVVPRRSLN